MISSDSKIRRYGFIEANATHFETFEKTESSLLLMTLDFETEDPPTLLQAGEQETTKTSAIYSRMDSSMYLP